MAAESIVFDVVTSGAESDLETATSIARQMVGRWGMSEKIGPVTVLPQEGDPRMAGISEGLLSAVDTEVRRLIDEAYANAKRLLEENRDRLESIPRNCSNTKLSTKQRSTPRRGSPAPRPPRNSDQPHRLTGPMSVAASSRC